MPSKTVVTNAVLSILSPFVKKSTADLGGKYFDTALQDPPLKMDSTGLGFLTISLRSYINHEGGIRNIIVTEVKKNGLTVKGLADLVYSKF